MLFKFACLTFQRLLDKGTTIPYFIISKQKTPDNVLSSKQLQ